MAETKRTGLDEATSYLKLNNTVYKLSRVTHPIKDIEKEIRDYYKGVYEGLIAEISDTVANNSVSIQQEQLDRIRRHIESQNRGNIMLPVSLAGKPVIYMNNAFFDIVPVLYTPLTHVTSKAYLISQLSKPADFLEGFIPADVGMETKLIIKLKSVEPLTILLAFNSSKNTLHTVGTQTFHTLTDYNKLCTGNANPATIWSMPRRDMEEYLNTVNHFSLGRSEIMCSYSDVRYTLANLINRDNIESVTKGGSRWQIE
jgi:hypothetical protein